ncbi:hypothetical protein GOB57_03860 [Sinorhizobium meliloti]|nr:hypothetical protein [Sinorhizobium meliloti]
MRILFFRPGASIYQPQQGIPFQVGLPPSCASSLEAHSQAFSLVGNAGNMIHRMAMIQMVECDRTRSSHVNLLKLKNTIGLDSAVSALNDNFDAVVITLSNDIREDASDRHGLSEILDRIKIPFFCVGAGLQGNIPANLASLRDDNRRLFEVINSKAALFGVRGETTRDWLRKAGLKNAVAIGCPSMFAYPRNIAALIPPKQVNRVMVAGHMTESEMKAPHGRGSVLLKALQGYECAYVFQGESRTFLDVAKETPFVYDEATGELDAAAVSRFIEKKSGIRPPFTKYYHFNEVSAWRQASTRYDVYVGDRIHGGVAAMQARVSALVLHADTRVAELTSFHGIPSCSVKEFARIGVHAAVSTHLSYEGMSAFHERYKTVLGNFAQTVTKAGLKLVNMREIEAVIERPLSSDPTVKAA